MTFPHWVICRATSIVPSVPDVADPPICGVAGGADPTAACAEGTSASAEKSRARSAP